MRAMNSYPRFNSLRFRRLPQHVQDRYTDQEIAYQRDLRESRAAARRDKAKLDKAWRDFRLGKGPAPDRIG